MTRRDCKIIPGYPRYSIDELGNVFNNRTGTHLRTTKDKQGYVRVCLYVGENKIKTIKIHKLVTITFIGDSNGLQVNHKDGNKANNCLSNLEYCTGSENMKHAFKNGFKVITKRQIDGLSAMAKMRVGSKNSGSRKVINTNSGFVYDTITDAANDFNLKRTTLIMMLNGSNKNKTPLKYYEHTKRTNVKKASAANSIRRGKRCNT